MRKNEFMHLLDKLDMLDEQIGALSVDLAVQKTNTNRIKKLEDDVEELNSFKSAAKGVFGFLSFMAGGVALFEYLRK